MLRTILLLAVVFAVGCGGPAPAPAKKGEEKKTAEKSGSKAADGTLEVAAEDLPAVGDPIALREPLVTIRKPKDWHRAGKDEDYLMRFYLRDGTPFPHVNITAAKTDLPDGDIDKLLEAVKADTAQLKPASIVNPPRKAKIGDKEGVYDIRKANIKNTIVERVVFNLVHGGWRYHIELRSLPANSTQYEPFLQAVAANMEFKGADADDEPKADAPKE